MNTSISQRRRFIQLLATMVLLMVADGVISEFLVVNGFGQEFNPLIKALVGGDAFLGVKVAGGLLAALLLYSIHPRSPKAAFRTTVFFVVFYTAILFWNLGVLLFSQSTSP